MTKAELDASMATILDAIKGVAPAAPAAPASRAFSVTKDAEPERKVNVEGAGPRDPRSSLTPEQQNIFEEYFDPADGFTAEFKYPYFTITVPNKFSNADPAWQKYYAKTGDTRVKFLKYDNLEGGMRDWCKMVAGNLKYNKLTKLK